MTEHSNVRGTYQPLMTRVGNLIPASSIASHPRFVSDLISRVGPMRKQRPLRNRRNCWEEEEARGERKLTQKTSRIGDPKSRWNWVYTKFSRRIGTIEPYEPDARSRSDGSRISIHMEPYNKICDMEVSFFDWLTHCRSKFYMKNLETKEKQQNLIYRINISNIQVA